ncbi:unnamed protein product [Ilex paraguariensis]|uniref:Uncharacterized protein n=1 Tax=Ilex paraguariensis TaxID=185542 RepID=A0ABC8RHW6_9AQUA
MEWRLSFPYHLSSIRMISFFVKARTLLIRQQISQEKAGLSMSIDKSQDGVEIKDVLDKSSMMRRTKLAQLASVAVDETSMLEEGTKLLTNTLEATIESIRAMKSSRCGQRLLAKRKDIHEQQNFNDSLQVGAKGCGKHLKSSKEKAMDKLGQCHGCGKIEQTHTMGNSCDSQNTNDPSE